MQLTTNYGFKKPDQADNVNIEDINYNMDISDEELKKINSHLAEITAKLKWHIVEVWGITAETGTTLVEYPAGSTKANCMMVAGYVVKANGVANSISANDYYYQNSSMSFTAIEAGRPFGVLLAKIF